MWIFLFHILYLYEKIIPVKFYLSSLNILENMGILISQNSLFII